MVCSLPRPAERKEPGSNDLTSRSLDDTAGCGVDLPQHGAERDREALAAGSPCGIVMHIADGFAHGVEIEGRVTLMAAGPEHAVGSNS